MINKIQPRKVFPCLYALFFLGLSSCDFEIVNDSTQLLSILNSLDDGLYPSINGGPLPISENIIINGTVTISSEDLIVPNTCMSSDYCSPNVSFENLYDHEGVSISPLSSQQDSPYMLILSDVKLRFRKIIRNLGGPPPPLDDYMRYTVIQIMPPSWKKCVDSQIKCVVDKVCYDSYYSYGCSSDIT